MTAPPVVKRGPRGRRPGLDVILGRGDVALAYELYQGGTPITLIAENFGCDASHLHRTFNRCKRDGLGWLLKP